MTRAVIERLVRRWVPRLGLERWRIEFCWDEPCDPEKERAKVVRSCFYDRATLYFASDFGSWSLESAEQTVVHELLHLCLRDVDEVLSDLDGQLQRDAAEMVDRRYRQAMESFVDRLSCRLVDLGG